MYSCYAIIARGHTTHIASDSTRFQGANGCAKTVHPTHPLNRWMYEYQGLPQVQIPLPDKEHVGSRGRTDVELR